MNKQVIELFYKLARDHLPVGVIESVVRSIERNSGDVVYSNKHLESMAIEWSTRVNNGILPKIQTK